MADTRPMQVMIALVAMMTIAMAAVIAADLFGFRACVAWAGGPDVNGSVMEAVRMREAPILRRLASALPEREGSAAVIGGVVKLQPYLYVEDALEARRLAGLIESEAEAKGVPPMIALAVARRESSLHPRVGLGLKRGKRGERGFFQVIPGGAAEETCGHGCDQRVPLCNARTAMCWMAKAMERCESSDPWVYVGAYGRSRCPRNRAEGRSWSEVRRARTFTCEAMGASCVDVWPL